MMIITPAVGGDPTGAGVAALSPNRPLKVRGKEQVGYVWSGRRLDFDKAELSIHGMEQTEPPPQQRASAA